MSGFMDKRKRAGLLLGLVAALLLLLAGTDYVRAADQESAGTAAGDSAENRIVPVKVKKIDASLADETGETDGSEEEFKPEIYIDHRKEMENHKEYLGDMIYFNQKDQVWNDNGYCVARSGCGPTSMAVVISSLTGKWVTPLDTIEWACKHDYYSGDGSVHEMIPALAKAYGLTCKGLGTNYNKIRAALKKGHPVVCLMGPGYFTAGGHFMVLTSIDSKNCVTVADVGSRERSSYKYRLKQVISQAKSASAGGPFWAMSYERMSGLAEGRTLRDYIEADPDDSFGGSFFADAQEGMADLTAASLAGSDLSRKYVDVSEPVTGGILKATMSEREYGQAFSALMTKKGWVPVAGSLSGIVSETGALSGTVSKEGLLTSGISDLRLE